MNDGIRGLWVALATPLQRDASVDHAAMAAHASSLIERGCDGVVLFGTTGEGPSFSAAERLAGVEALLQAGVAPERIGLGAGMVAIPDSVALTRAALGLGLTQILLLPPFFFRDAPDRGIEDAFAAIVEGVGDPALRATLYHIPQVSGVAVPAAAAASLRRRFGAVIAGVKDSSGVFAQFEAFRAAAPELAVTVGRETDIARALAAGGAGTICGMANLVPALVRAMFRAGDAEPAMAEAVGLISGPFVPALKAALAAVTAHPGWSRVRPPLRPGDEARAQAVAETLRRLEASHPA